MKNEKILTVVVPTYNAEKYLEKNLNSLCVEELLSKIEVIIVNDGSTDSSKNIAQKYADKYPDSYKVITKENGGHGSGINYGIMYAQGYYFKVLDADDWVEDGAFKNLVNYLKICDDDIVYSGFLWAFDNHSNDEDSFYKKPELKEPFGSVQYKQSYLFTDIAEKLYIKIHNLTIKTKILQENNISIDTHCYYVDTELITYPIPYVKTISFVEDNVYMYRIGRVGQSVSIEKMQKNERNYDKVIQSLTEFYDELGKTIPCTIAHKNYVAGIIARVVAGKIKILLSYPASRERLKECKEYDARLKKKYPDIYYKNKNMAIKILRWSSYKSYWIAHSLLNVKFKVSSI